MGQSRRPTSRLLKRLKKLGAEIERNKQGEVVEVDLRTSKITDTGLVHLKGMTGLQVLYLTDAKITDAGLVHLKGMNKLQVFTLPDQITDAGLVHLSGMTELYDLGLYGTEITDAGLAHLKGLTAPISQFGRCTEVGPTPGSG